MHPNDVGKTLTIVVTVTIVVAALLVYLVLREVYLEDDPDLPLRHRAHRP